MLGGVFAAVIALLVLGYFLFLRTEYVVLAQGLRGSDASAVVAELDKRGTPYRITGGGSTILVPNDQADATRVALAGSESAARGEIGFELFNKSDMGLTNFAQKINYQRALQGELVRTIMVMDGVESARVHLSMPERALFRGDRAEPRAAVTVAMKAGQIADAPRVAGIQRLVASAVPDLPESKVVVLDSGGRVISQAVSEALEGERPADLEERSAVGGYYRARARGAIERQIPGLNFLLKVLVVPQASIARTPPESDAESAGSGWLPAGEGPARNFRLRFILVSKAGLNAGDQEAVRAAIVQATGADFAQGDNLSFEVGPVDTSVATSPLTAPPPAAAPLPSPTPIAAAADWPVAWIFAVVGMAGLLLLGWMLIGPSKLRAEDHEAFADKLRSQLNRGEGEPDAGA